MDGNKEATSGFALPQKSCSTRNDQKVAASARPQPTGVSSGDCSMIVARHESCLLANLVFCATSAPTRCNQVSSRLTTVACLFFISVSALSAPSYATTRVLQPAENHSGSLQGVRLPKV